jgi:hypothetical protein
MLLLRFLLGVEVALTLGTAFCQPMPAPVKTTVCEVAANPERFSGNLVSLRDRIAIAFEQFELSAGDCSARKIDAVWLEYGRGPKRQPTTWCCGDMTPRDPLELVQDKAFRKFHHYLTAETGARGCHQGECYSYHVTATLIGRFNAVATEPFPNGKTWCCPSGGYGHFGASCARLVIQSVADVVAERAFH